MLYRWDEIMGRVRRREERMTVKERAKEATRMAGGNDWGRDDQEELEAAVEVAINEAIEQCAKIAQDHVPGLEENLLSDGAASVTAQSIRDKIRAIKSQP